MQSEASEGQMTISKTWRSFLPWEFFVFKMFKLSKGRAMNQPTFKVIPLLFRTAGCHSHPLLLLPTKSHQQENTLRCHVHVITNQPSRLHIYFFFCIFLLPRAPENVPLTFAPLFDWNVTRQVFGSHKIDNRYTSILQWVGLPVGTIRADMTGNERTTN